MPLYWWMWAGRQKQKEFPTKIVFTKAFGRLKWNWQWWWAKLGGTRNSGEAATSQAWGAKRGRGYRNSVEAVAGGGAACQGMQPWVRKANPPKPWLSRERAREKKHPDLSFYLLSNHLASHQQNPASREKARELGWYSPLSSAAQGTEQGEGVGWI